MITPAISLIRGGRIDMDAAQVLMHFLKKSGVRGVFIAGSTGYTPMLAAGEHRELLKQYMQQAKIEGLDIFAGIGRNSIEETLSMGKYAIDMGADRLVIVTPYYIKEDQRQLHAYYSRLLGKLDANILIYNVPFMTGNNIEADTIAKLGEENSNLQGVKSTNADFNQFQRLIYYTEKDFLVFQGYDHLLLPSLEIGASGGACGTSNFTDMAAKLYDAYNGDDPGRCIKLHKALSEVYHALEPYEFPNIYNAMFYRLVMKKAVGTGSILLNSLGAKEINLAARKLKGIINWTVR